MVASDIGRVYELEIFIAPWRKRHMPPARQCIRIDRMGVFVLAVSFFTTQQCCRLSGLVRISETGDGFVYY